MSRSGRMVGRLKKRRDFVAAAKGPKVARRSFVLEIRARDDDGPSRFGFTVSKRTAKKAVERNRIRRRLKEAVRLGAADACAGRDYVLVGRRGALDQDFSGLRSDLAGALKDAPLAGSKSGRQARSASR